MYQLTDEQKAALIARYSGRFHVPLLSYGTVRDYCDSCDHLPWLASVQNDLKDLQRPWTVKAALGLVPVGSRLLEIGSGQPLVAAFLAELGYKVTVVDPYDGSGGGPTEFDTFVQLYPKVQIVRRPFQANLPELANQTFDGIYSISVLEHIPAPDLTSIVDAISCHLTPGGCVFHSVDCVIEGADAVYHVEQCKRVALYHKMMTKGLPTDAEDITTLFETARHDLETCYLSAAGHNLWRGAQPYETFPFRKVLSFQFATNRRNGQTSLAIPQGEIAL
jgi:2-polyprenyl-3-methyl-5-hydroxy-6-metoxy-1,4-benzoquinol methylase